MELQHSLKETLKVPIDPTVPAKLIDPETGEPTDETSVEVPGEGTYTINPETGEVTFKPEPNFTGKAQGIEVQRKDTNGTPATAKYTPTVQPVTPTSDDVVSEDVQGAKQTGTPVFTPGKTTVNGKEVTVKSTKLLNQHSMMEQQRRKYQEKELTLSMKMV